MNRVYNHLLTSCLVIFSSLFYCIAIQADESKSLPRAQSIKTLNAPFNEFPELTQAIQMSHMFEDSKTFVDSQLLKSPEAISAAYAAAVTKKDFSLKKFVQQHFKAPGANDSNFHSDVKHGVENHINTLWDVLLRSPADADANNSLLALPNPYIVPGGRFREIYYWDSYFTMLGLRQAQRIDIIENMVANFAFLINTYGFIPNGNRSYYLSRSQPPFFSLMVELLAAEKGNAVLLQYLPQLQKEYDFWMDGEKTLKPGDAHRRVVRLKSGEILNRYWDDSNQPRLESYREDVELVAALKSEDKDTYRHIRAAAESGWDFSSRWFKDGKNLSTVHTTDIIPVDLNALLYHLESTLALAYIKAENVQQAKYYQNRAQQRQNDLIQLTWNKKSGFFYDYDFVNQQLCEIKSLAAMYPLFFKLASDTQAKKMAKHIKQDFLKPGGVVTTLGNTGQQWDSPNGWAPLQWITVQGLRNYQHTELASTIKQRWIKLNSDVFQRTGKLLEKYNVLDMKLEGGGGEYPVQDGFGWTNGVLLQFLKEDTTNKTPKK
ncbi:Periplasmic trehalase [Thalassocella blandensis]|nr:Periplasmic trehalase [Thalassocella blandensis]